MAGAVSVLAVAVTAVAAFAAGIGNAFIGDDTVLLTSRLADVTPGEVPRLFLQSYWGTIHEGALYRPLALAVLVLQKAAFGDSPWGYHVLGIALHALCSIGLFVLLRRWEASATAVTAALLFAAHPIHAEAVLTVHGQQDVWATAFLLAAALLAVSAEPARWRYPAAASCYLASLLFKEQGVFAPFIALCLIGLTPPRDAESQPSRSFEMRLAVPWFAAALAVYLALRVLALGGWMLPTGPAVVADDYSASARGQLVLVTLATYGRLLIFPTGQTTYYGHLRSALIGSPFPLLATLVVVGALFAVAARQSRPRTARAASAWLAATLLPISNIVPIGSVVAERLLLPSERRRLRAGGGSAHQHPLESTGQRRGGLPPGRGRPGRECDGGAPVDDAALALGGDRRPPSRLAGWAGHAWAVAARGGLTRWNRRHRRPEVRTRAAGHRHGAAAEPAISGSLDGRWQDSRTDGAVRCRTGGLRSGAPVAPR